MADLQVSPADPAAEPAARALAARLGVPLASACALEAEGAVCIEVGSEGMRCRALLPSGVASLDIDYAQGAFARRALDPRLNKSPLAKAVGKAKSAAALRVLDATMGLARDSLMLAAMGHHVTAVERSRAVFALVEDGLRRAQHTERIAAMVERLAPLCGDARDVLRSGQFDVVYVDPMFPDEGRTAAVKKDLQILRLLIDDDAKGDDLADLVSEARAQGAKVVVKRPAHAVPVVEGVSRTVEGKGMRFDVYLSPAVAP